jgi:hypothetical protein
VLPCDAKCWNRREKCAITAAEAAAKAPEERMIPKSGNRFSEKIMRKQD